MSFVSATAFGNQSSEKHYLRIVHNFAQASVSASEERYQQIVQDFAQASIPDLEILDDMRWRVGRCIYQEDVSKLYPAIFGILRENNGPYYDAAHRAYLYRPVEINNYPAYLRSSFFDTFTSDKFLNDVENNSRHKGNNRYSYAEWGDVSATANSVEATIIRKRHADFKMSIRSFEEMLLISINSNEGDPIGMCYFFIEIE